MYRSWQTRRSGRRWTSALFKDIAKALCEQAVKQWFRHATGKDLSDPKVYESVRAQIASLYRSAWTDRLNSENSSLTY
jgi:hypothetical protein